MPDCDVLVLGDYFCDLIITGLSEVPRLGADIFGDKLDIAPGGPYILTTALHRLGIRAGWRTRVGTDVFSKFMLDEALKEGLDTSFFKFLDAPFRSLSFSFSLNWDSGILGRRVMASVGIFTPGTLFSLSKSSMRLDSLSNGILSFNH